MKKNCCHNKLFFLFIFLAGSYFGAAQIDTLFIDQHFTSRNLKPFSEINKNHNGKGFDSRNYFYFSFENEYNTIDFTVKNKLAESKNLIVELTNALIKEVTFYKNEKGDLTPLFITGIEHPISSKAIEHRHFCFPIKLNAHETATYTIKLKKESGKPLVTSASIKTEKHFIKQGFIQQFVIGSYYGISLLSVIFSLSVYYFIRKATYIIYAGYVVFLGLFISSYIGVFSQIFLNEGSILNKYTHYALFSEISMLLFVVFSQKILEAKTFMPKLKRLMDALLISVVSIRLLIHFFLTNLFENYVAVFMKIWYVLFLIMLSVITAQIIIYFRRKNTHTSFFAMAYVFMIIGTLATILYHSYGLLNTLFYGLPIIFYSSYLEILFLTFTVVFMVKDIYDERNILSKKIVIQEKKNLNAFIKGEDQERKRIGKELHDNIGSQLSYLKRFVSDKFKDQNVNETIDAICHDVRNLSHEISPSNLKIVGFELAVKELAETLSNQTTLNIDFYSHHFPENIEDDISTQLYRVVQEALNNIIKHADAHQIEIQLLGHDNLISITIEDDGKGFNLQEDATGLGLKNMHSRIQQIGGNFSLDSQKNKGTAILITLNT